MPDCLDLDGNLLVDVSTDDPEDTTDQFYGTYDKDAQTYSWDSRPDIAANSPSSWPPTHVHTPPLGPLTGPATQIRVKGQTSCIHRP